MANVVYSMEKLEKSKEMDVSAAITHFIGMKAYFNALTQFTEESNHYLKGYNPMLIQYSEDIRKDFLSETQQIKGKLQALGLTALEAALADVEEAACGNTVNTLADWLLKFNASCDSAAAFIVSARVNREAIDPMVLAVDDKPELLATIVSMLEGHFKVMAVTSGKAALKVLEKHTPTLFLLDIEMPDMNGHELADLIRKDSRFVLTPIVFLTSRNSRNDVMTAINNGCEGYLLKPVDQKELIDMVAQHLG